MKTVHLKTLSFIFLIIVVFLSSCKKEEDLIGLDVQPEDNRLSSNYTDTVTVIAYSQWDDSITTNRFDANLLGSIYNPVFGITTASFYTQVRLPGDNVTFGASPVADSLVFSLAYKGVYGDSTDPVHLTIYEVLKKMYVDSSYYSYQKLPVDQSPLAETTFTPDTKDSITVDGVKYPPHLRIKITNQSFINKIIAASGTSQLSDNDNFSNFIKGFYFSCGMNLKGGSIIYFNLESTLTKLTMYYHNSINNDSLKYDFVINEKTARYNHFEHYNYNYSSSDFRKQLIEKDTAKGKDLLYLQATAGVKIKLYFPHLMDLVKNKKIAVNEASLLISQNDYATDNIAPAIIGVFKLDEKRNMLALTADMALGNNYFGGYYTNKTYKFRITNYIQSILNGKEIQRGLAMIVDKRRTSANNVVLNGTGAGYGSKRLRLALKYTVIQ